MDKIKYFVMDVDGTLTDGKLYIGPSGEIMKAFNIKDGCGIHEILIPNGIVPVVITGRQSDIVSTRCKELGIKEIHQGVKNKKKALEHIVEDLSLVAYIGDDINDLDCMIEIASKGGIVACPSDAPDIVKNNSKYVCSKKGGDGCVREFIEWCLSNNE